MILLCFRRVVDAGVQAKPSVAWWRQSRTVAGNPFSASRHKEITVKGLDFETNIVELDSLVMVSMKIENCI